MNPAPPVIRRVTLYRGPLRVLQREPQFLRQRIDGCPGAFPRAVGLEPEVPDTASPRCDHAADGSKVGALGVLLIQPAGDIGRDADERSQRRRRSDAVLAAVPRPAEYEGDLLEVVDEELLGVLVRVGAAPRRERVRRKQLLELLRER